MMFSNKQLTKLIWPLVIEQILTMIVGMADTMMVSYAGEAAISGVGLVDMINNLIITVLAAIATGGAVIVCQYLGSQKKEQANFAASQLMTITAIISIAIMVLCLVFHRGLLQLFFGSIEADVMNACIIYFLITALSFPFLGIYNSSAAIFRSIEKTKVTMYISLLMNIINIIGNYIGVIILQAGVAGVAFPTLISRIVAAIIMLVLSFNHENPIYIKTKEIFTFNTTMIKKILQIAVPNGIENGLFTLGRVLVTSIVAVFGTSQIAANSVAGIKKLMKISYIITAIIGGVVILALPILLNLYSLSETARNYTYILVIMHNIMAFALHPTSFVLPNGLRSAGDVKYSMFVGIISMLIFRLGSAYLFGIIFDLGIIGVWIAMGADWACRSVLFMIRFVSAKWKKYKLI